MADKLTPEQRHLCMSHIRGKDTKPEMFVRKALWQLGYRYRLNVADLPGRPDIVLPKYKTIIFVNGCFWHGHEGCKKFTVPETNRDFWMAKIERNRQRDLETFSALRVLGWNVITVWSCELSTKEKRGEVISRLAACIRRNG